jgi:hypothetical protein
VVITSEAKERGETEKERKKERKKETILLLTVTSRGERVSQMGLYLYSWAVFILLKLKASWVM